MCFIISSGPLSPVNGGTPCERREQHAADRVDVGLRVDVPPAALLRRHVQRRALDRPGRGQAHVVLALAHQGDAEVEDLDPPAVA
jgi:hypothetical protein